MRYTGQVPGSAVVAEIEPILIIERALSSMCGILARQARKTPFALTPINCSQSASLVSTMVLSICTPALLTRVDSRAERIQATGYQFFDLSGDRPYRLFATGFPHRDQWGVLRAHRSSRVRAFCDEAIDDGAPDALTATGNDGGLSFESLHLSCPRN